MLNNAIKARLAVKVGALYKRRNAEHTVEHLTPKGAPEKGFGFVVRLAKGPALRGGERRAETLL